MRIQNLFKCLVALLVCIQPALGTGETSEVGQAVATNHEYTVDLLAMSGEVIESGFVTLTPDEVQEIEAKRWNDVLEDKFQQIFMPDPRNSPHRYNFGANDTWFGLDLVGKTLRVKTIKRMAQFYVEYTYTYDRFHHHRHYVNYKPIKLFLIEPDSECRIHVELMPGRMSGPVPAPGPVPGYYDRVSELKLEDICLYGSIYQGEKFVGQINTNRPGQLEELRATIRFAKSLARKTSSSIKDFLESFRAMRYQFGYNKCTITEHTTKKYCYANLYVSRDSETYVDMYTAGRSSIHILLASLSFVDETKGNWFCSGSKKPYARDENTPFYSFFPERPERGLILRNMRFLHKTYEFQRKIDLAQHGVLEGIMSSLYKQIDRTLNDGEWIDKTIHRRMDVLDDINLADVLAPIETEFGVDR